MEKLPIEGFENLSVLIPKLITQFNGVGVNVSVISNAKISSIHCYGYSDKENEVKMQKDTVFQLASISKPITAWGIMKLVEEGKIELDDPVSKHISRWKIPTDYEKFILKKYCPDLEKLDSIINHDEITIRRLLSHTAGLSVHGYPGMHPEDEFPSIEESLNGDSACGIVRPIYPPGTRFSYSGGGYTILQLLIEEITEKSFSEYMDEVILDPLGMKNSSFNWIGKVREKMAKAYSDLATEIPQFEYTALAAAGCLSTIEDLSKFVIASMNGPKGELPGRNILKPETIELMFTKVRDLEESETDIPTAIGLGYFLNFPKELPGIIAVQHSGGNTGWRTFMISIPSAQLGLVILTNSQTGMKIIDALILKWKDYLIKKLEK